jgi:catechol 2,3-dioxygenase-like lactoylglutathione lyase family enzyme
MTVVVSDLEEAKRFFAVLGFEESQSVVVEGDAMSGYMGIPGWRADHVTLSMRPAATHQEVQLLRFHSPAARLDSGSGSLDRTGFNHLCFRVEDLTGTVDAIRAAGFRTRNEPMTFHDRSLVFVEGPAGVTVELSQWLPADEERSP